MKLKQGELYNKKQLGLTQVNETMQVNQVVEGELYSFFTMVGDKDNFVEPDGFVYETFGCHLVPPNVHTDLHRHILLRKSANEDYEYLGKSVAEKRYNEDHNKALFENLTTNK